MTNDITENPMEPGVPMLPMGPILVVDDDEPLLAVTRELLELEGYEVHTAGNGEEALRAIQSAPPAVVLLDMRMPVMDGWQFARELERRAIRLPILVMTAAKDAGAWAEEIGARGCVAKPFDAAELLGLVKRTLDES